MKKHNNGFTVIELIFTILLLSFACILFFTQKQSTEATSRDDKKKTAINVIYYSLEEVFYNSNKYYPQNITSEILPSVDPELLKDSEGLLINTVGSAYNYFPTDCLDNKCKKYTLKASLEKEADFIKTNRN